MSDVQNHAEAQQNREPNTERGETAPPTTNKAVKAANRWVLASFCLYLLLVGFVMVVSAGTETLSHDDRSAFSLANATLRSLIGVLIGTLLIFLPALAVTWIFIRSSRPSIRGWCVILGFLLSPLFSCLLGGNPFWFYILIPASLVEIISIAVATFDGAVQSGEWWRESTMICLCGGLGLWSLSWLIVPIFIDHGMMHDLWRRMKQGRNQDRGIAENHRIS